MKARVKQDCKQDMIRSAGLVWSKFDWKDVPAWAEGEIGANPFLEIEAAPVQVKSPPEAQAEPLTAEDKATRLVMSQPGKRGRKL